MKRIIFLFVISLFLLTESGIAAQNKTTNIPIIIQPMLLPEKYSLPRTKPITHIVIHSISNIVSKPQSPYEINDIRHLLMEHGVSAHYVIDREGTVFRLVPEGRVAFHAGRSNLPYAPFFDHGMNHYSIGIELMGIGTKEEMLSIVPEKLYNQLDTSLIGYTKAQYTTLSRLLECLYKRYPAIQKDRYHIIGHDEYAPVRKQDPGQLFNWNYIGF
jgi:N-acetyl-anhydromuramyl-L-alanine amidase AmpD